MDNDTLLGWTAMFLVVGLIVYVLERTGTINIW